MASLTEHENAQARTAGGGRAVDVVVIGGGVSGLCAARKLAQNNVSCVLLEARDRVGGRTLSHRLGNDTIDLGGQWLGPTQDRIAALARELGVSTFPQFSQGKKILARGGRVSTYSGNIPGLPLFSQLELGWIQVLWEKQRRQLPVDAPWKAPRAAEWDAMTVETWKRRHARTAAARDVVDIAVRAVFCGEPSEISYLYFLNYLNSGQGLDCLTSVQNGAQQDRVIGGMQQISIRMAEQLGDRVVLEAAVRAIEQSNDGVLIRSAAGDFRAATCIVALPPALAGRIHYEPALPARRDHLSQRMPMGSVIKYIATYEKPFWREAGYSGELVTDGGAVGLAFDDSSHDGKQAALVAFTDGGPAREMGDLSPEDRRTAVLQHLSQYFGPQAAQPLDFIEKNWMDEQWSRGCYVGLMPPGVMTTLGEALRTPCGRIHWAGTETATKWMGYIDGAVEAGYRSAEEVMARLHSQRGASAL